MFQLLETIKIKNGIAENIEFHNERFNRSRKDLFKINGYEDIESSIKSAMKISAEGTFKCRILYDNKIRNIQIIPYHICKIRSLKIIEDNNIQYDYKYENREAIHHLLTLRKACDDILIIKNGFVTDTSYCNIVFKKADKFYTPNTPLLNGTKRAKLIKQEKISEFEIKLTDIKSFQKAYLINAMIDIEDKIEISIDKII
jgi:4-amino-4-deoxychorismate lyase